MKCLTNICINLFVILFAVHIKITIAQFNKPWNDKYENNKCPKLYPKNFVNYAPVGNLTAGNYSEKTSLKGLRQCVMTCCLADSCNIVFIYDSRCFHVECVSNELCLPLLRVGSHKWESHVSMILVKPVLPNENWSDILEQTNYREVNNNLPPDEDSTLYSPYTSHRNDLITDDEDSNYLSRFINNLPSMDDDDRGYEKYRENNDSDMIMDATTFLEKESCDIGADDCPINSECIPIGLKLNRGICKCVPGTEEDSQGNCVQTPRPFSKGPTSAMDTIMKSGDLTSDPKIDDLKTETTSSKTIQKLTVSVISKEVQLPENEVTLSAYTIPNEKEAQSRYRYVWTLVDQPKDKFTGNMNQNGATVTLTDLTEGQYRFKVSVNGTNAYGEGFANVTVLPRQRVNSAPIAVITPQAQTVKLPNTGAVLDGSLSKDDVKIISYHWELTSGPLGYQPPLQDGATLELKDLKLPGNYTFKLTVEDSDNVKNSTTANITVLNHTDYPPEANAGQDVILYLPNNNLTLNGSLSTDDHEIVSWEWTKAAEDENKAVDMQNTHSPYLQLSNLSEGVYTFVLKVTDSSGQSSTAEVHVFVKPPTHTPPVADAGDQISISLPQTWAILNGTKSHGETALVSYTWRYVSGPSIPSLRSLANATAHSANVTSSLSGATASLANATALTKGQYVFELTVLDDNGNTNAANVTVNVAQNANMPPVANAGGDQVLSLPLAVLTLNGSRSSDDFRIVTWRWRRAPLGLAAGTIILHSDTQPVLMLTDIEPGRYVFELTVSDDQGSSSSDTVSVQVKPDPLEPYLLELTLNSPVAAFTQAQLDALVQKTTLLLKGIQMNVTQVRGDLDSGNTQLIFFLNENDAPVEGTRALSLAREALRAGAGASAGATRVRTLHCISTCSGRGRCDRATRSCRCDAFWMQSLFTLLDPDAQPDCDWSVVYLSVGGVAALCAVGGACWACARLARRTCGSARRAERRPHRRATSYRLLPRADHDTLLSNKDISESETDSDVLFECKSKSTSFSRSLNGSAAHHDASNAWTNNGFNSTRKLKT